MNKDETLKFALDVLKNTASWNASQQYTREQKAITAIKAALLSRSDGEAKDEQQPTEQWAATSAMDAIPSSIEAVPASLKLQAEIEAMMLTTVKKQRTWVSLSEDEITQEVGDSQGLRDIIRNIEHKLKEKNT
jgi:hypothetical protein